MFATQTGSLLFLVRVFFIVFTAFGSFLPVSISFAEEKEEASQAASTSSTLFSESLGGNHFLQEKGLFLGVAYKADAVSNWKGGTHPHHRAFLGNLDLTLRWDLAPLTGLSGWSVFLYGLGNHGGKPSHFNGESQLTSNIEAYSTFKLYEAYVQKKIDDRLSVLLGLHDLNVDFYTTDSSASFLNSSFGVSYSLGQTGLNGPSIFPTTSLALSFQYKSPSAFYFQSGIFNARAGNPDHRAGTQVYFPNSAGHLLIWEAGWKKEGSCQLSAGAWMYSQGQTPLDSSLPLQMNRGWYLLLDQRVFGPLAVFGRYGTASPVINRFQSGTEAGFTLTGLLPHRPEDVLGGGLAIAQSSPDFQRLELATKHELVTEIFYKLAILPGFTLTPDYQTIQHPSAGPEVPRAHVGTLRLKLVF